MRVDPSRRRRRSAVVVVVLVWSLALLMGCSTPPETVPDATDVLQARARADVPYATASPAQRFDLWLPEGPRPAPLVIFVHGGGFLGGDKRAVLTKVPPLLDAGYAVASLDYRLSGEARFPAAPRDVKAAVRHLRARAAEYRVDPARFAVWGESAGGNLAALAGTTGDQTTLFDDPALASPSTSAAVQAVVDWYGPVDFAARERQLRAAGPECRTPQIAQADAAVTRYLGADVDTVPALASRSDPVTYVPTARALPPFSIAHGTADCRVPLAQSRGLADALRRAGAAPDERVLPGFVHGDPRFDAEVLAPTIAWLDGVLAR